MSRKNQKEYSFSVIASQNVNQIPCDINNCEVYIQGFPCSKTQQMADYAEETRKNSNFIAVHIGPNDLLIKKEPDVNLNEYLMWKMSHIQFKLKLQSQMFVEITEATIRFHILVIYLIKSKLNSLKISLAA